MNLWVWGNEEVNAWDGMGWDENGRKGDIDGARQWIVRDGLFGLMVLGDR